MSDQSPDPTQPENAPPPPAPPSYGNAPQLSSDPGAAAAAVPANPPPPLALAVKLMYAGAVLSVIGLLLAAVDTQAIRDAASKNGNLTAAQIDTAVTVGVVVGILLGLIGAGLWVLNAVFNARGARWARILSTVLGGLAIISTLASLAQANPALTKLLGVLQLVLAAVIVFLIWRPESSSYYAARSGPRR